LKDNTVSSIINSNTIYLFSVESKIQTLLSYYLPLSKVIDDEHEIREYNYVFTSDNETLDKLYVKQVFKLLKNLTIISY